MQHPSVPPRLAGAAGVAELGLEPEADQVPGARRFAVRAAAALGAEPDVQDTVATLVSELVTNVVLHARTPALLRLSDRGACVHVAVTDASPALPRRQRRLGRLDSTGRGLRLLEVLAAEHGVDRDQTLGPQGKTVWFTLRKVASAPDQQNAQDEQTDLAAVLAVFDSEGW